MKLRHKTHGWAPDHTDPAWAVQVEVEAERHTAAAERAWIKAARRLAKAERRAEAAEAHHAPRGRTADLWAEVARRREELKRLEAVMQGTPAGAQHRGKGAHRGVGTGEAL